MSSTCPHNMVNFGLLAAEISLPVWGTPPNFNGIRILAALLHSSKVVSVSQTLRCWTEGATYVRQGDHHVGHWPTFIVFIFCCCYLLSKFLDCMTFSTIFFHNHHHHHHDNDKDNNNRRCLAVIANMYGPPGFLVDNMPIHWSVSWVGSGHTTIMGT